VFAAVRESFAAAESSDACLLSVRANVSQVTDVREDSHVGSNASVSIPELMCALRHAPKRQKELEPATSAIQKRLEARGRHSNISCAVVSNSGVMLHHNYGQEIDGADLVFRFNDAILGSNLSAYVGMRDDVRILNHLTGENMVANPEQLQPDVLYVFMRAHMQGGAKYAALAESQPKSQTAILFGLPTVDNLSKQIVSSAASGAAFDGVITTGFYGMVLAMSVCDSIRAYGFVVSDNSADAPFHYYGSLKTGSANSNPAPKHGSAMLEKKFWRQAASNQDSASSDVALVSGFSQVQC